MKVLVAGSGGFIGWYVARELEAQGHELVPFDRPNDVRDVGKVTQAMRGADAAINLAGVLGTENTLVNQRESAYVNVIGAITLMDACERLGDKPMVQIGTGHKGQPNTYAITKGAAEDLALSRAQWGGRKIAVVRAFHVYGARQVPPKPWGDGHAHKIFPVFAMHALQGTPLPLIGGGKQVVDMVHASSVARVLVAAATDQQFAQYGTVIEAGTGMPRTVREVAWDITDMIGRGARLEDAPQRTGEPLGAEVYAQHPSSLIPIQAAWPFKVHETLAWYGQHYDR